jgi:hypothetical protein
MLKSFSIKVGIIFVVLCAIIYFLAETTALVTGLLMGGNVFLCLLTLFSFYILTKKKENDTSGRKFVNAMLASVMIRLFSCIIAIGIVAFQYRLNISIVNYLILMFLYIIYSAIETQAVSKLNKQINS